MSSDKFIVNDMELILIQPILAFPDPNNRQQVSSYLVCMIASQVNLWLDCLV